MIECKKCGRFFVRTSKRGKVCVFCKIPKKIICTPNNSNNKIDIDKLKAECERCGYLYSKYRRGNGCPLCEYYEEIWNK